MSEGEVMTKRFIDTAEKLTPEQLVKGMLDLVLAKKDFKSQALYLAMFKHLARKLVIKLELP